MKAYLFRFFTPSELEPSGWVGFALVPDLEALFWQIDSHGDPYGCEIQECRDSLSWCAHLDQQTLEYSEHELHVEAFDSFLSNDKAWQPPPWALESAE